MEGVEDEQAVRLHIGEQGGDAFLPVIQINFVDDQAVDVLLQRPVQQIVDILKMIIKGLTADFRIVRDILNGDAVQRRLRQELFQGHGEHAFCRIGHGFTPFLSVIVPFFRFFVNRRMERVDGWRLQPGDS